MGSLSAATAILECAASHEKWDCSASILPELLRALHADYTFMVQAYFDESGTHHGAPVTCVAGYLFESEQCLRLDSEWKEALDQFGIQYFHMADCAGGGKLFRGRSIAERDNLERKLIGIIKRRARIGVVASVRPEDHAHFAAPSLAERGAGYVLCLLWCIMGVSAWINKHKYNDKIAYFFEAGHQLEGRANQAMVHLSGNPTLREGARYSSHTFIMKDEARPIQAADILAWQWYKEWTNRFGEKRRPRRRDLESLLGLPHMACHLTAEHLNSMLLTTGGLNPEYLRRFEFLT